MNENLRSNFFSNFFRCVTNNETLQKRFWMLSSKNNDQKKKTRMSIAKIFASQENVKMILYHTKRLLKKPYYHFTERIFTDVIAKAREIYSQNILMIKLTFFTKIYMKKMGMMVSICKQLLMKITAVKTIMIVSNYRECQTKNKKQ